MDGCLGVTADCNPAVAELARLTTGGVCLGVCCVGVVVVVVSGGESGLGLYLLSIRKNSSRLNGFAESVVR